MKSLLKKPELFLGKTKKTSKKEKNKVREYKKSGGREQLEKDFDKMPGESSRAKDGTETKNLPDGTTIIKSPGSNNGPTLEIQPPPNNPKYPDPGIRVKVRY